MFKDGNFAKVWELEDKGKWTRVNMSTSRKNKDDGTYKTDFSSKFVKFIGKAHEMAKHLKENDRIKIVECGTTVEKGNDEKWYTNFLVFNFELQDGYSNAPKQVDDPYEGDEDPV